MDIACYDSFVACFDAKYTYWAPRPAMLDPAITTVFVTSNHPNYPSAHGCLSSAAGTVLASLFPRDAAYYEALVAEVSESRIMGGIHLRSHQVVGESIGRSVAGVVLAALATDNRIAARRGGAQNRTGVPCTLASSIG